MSNREKYAPSAVAFWTEVYAFVRESVPSLFGSVDLDAFLGLITREECNSFGYWDDGEELYGYGLFPHASFFNHDCAPNTFKSNIGRCLSLGWFWQFICVF